MQNNNFKKGSDMKKIISTNSTSEVVNQATNNKNNKRKKMKTPTNKLKIGFWFGFYPPVNNNDEYFTKKLDRNNLLSEYNKFQKKYIKFKKRYTSNTVPYKNSLEEEKCFIFFPESVGIKFTTFQEVYLMAISLDNELKKIKNMEDE